MVEALQLSFSVSYSTLLIFSGYLRATIPAAPAGSRSENTAVKSPDINKACASEEIGELHTQNLVKFEDFHNSAMRFQLLLATAMALFASSVTAACSCQKVSNPGLYCGYCEAVTSCGRDEATSCYNNAYECNKSGGCYEYGKSSRCNWSADKWPPKPAYCDGRDTWDEAP